MAAPRRIRIELDQDQARALHAALTAALAGALVDTAEVGAARTVLEQLDRRVPDKGATLARDRWAAAASLPHWRIPAPPLPGVRTHVARLSPGAHEQRGPGVP